MFSRSEAGGGVRLESFQILAFHSISFFFYPCISWTRSFRYILAVTARPNSWSQSLWESTLNKKFFNGQKEAENRMFLKAPTQLQQWLPISWSVKKDVKDHSSGHVCHGPNTLPWEVLGVSALSRGRHLVDYWAKWLHFSRYKKTLCSHLCVFTVPWLHPVSLACSEGEIPPNCSTQQRCSRRQLQCCPGTVLRFKLYDL